MKMIPRGLAVLGTLATSTLISFLIDGGTTATLGFTTKVLHSLGGILKNNLDGSLFNQLLDAKNNYSAVLNHDLEKAYKASLKNTFNELRKEFYSEEGITMSLIAQINIRFNNITTEEFNKKTSIERLFFKPLEEALSNQVLIDSIFRDKKEVQLDTIVKDILLNCPNVEYPYFVDTDKDREKLLDIICRDFNKKFLSHFNNELKLNKNAETVYHTNLLQACVKNLTEIIDGQKTLLSNQTTLKNDLKELIKFSSWNKLDMEILKSQNSQILTQINEVKEILTTNYSPVLKVYDKRPDHIDMMDRSQFESLFTDFVGRSDELNLIFDFLEDEGQFLWLMIEGPSGSGKSRLANEACLRSREIGWESGFAPMDQNKNFNWGNFRPVKDTLIVFDFVRSRKEDIRHILESCKIIEDVLHHKSSPKIRVLLLERYFDENLIYSLDSVSLRYNYFGRTGEESTPLHLPEMGEDTKWLMLEQIFGGADNEENLLKRKTEILQQISQQDPLNRPLFTLFSGIALTEGQNIAGWDTQQIIHYYLKIQEENLWSRNNLWHKHKSSLKNLLWLATICEYLVYADMEYIIDNTEGLIDFELNDENDENLDELFSAFKEIGRLVEYPGLKPDILGEYFIVKHIEDLSKSPKKRLRKVVISLLELAWELRPENTAWMTYLTADNFGSSQGYATIEHFLLSTSIRDSESFNAEDFMLEMGILFYNNQCHSKAIDYLSNTILTDNHIAVNMLALCQSHINNHTAAEKYFLKAITLNNPSASYNLAMLYMSLGRNLEAEQHFMSAIELYKHSDAVLQLALLYYNGNIKKDSALQLITNRENGNFHINPFVALIINLWCSQFDYYFDNRDSLTTLALAADKNDIEWYLFNLLVHKQEAYVLEEYQKGSILFMFLDNENIYYEAARYLLNNETSKMPGNGNKIEKMILDIEEKRKFYSL